MSHITIHKERISDINLFCEIAKRLGYSVGRKTKVRMYGSNVVEDANSIHITGWRYPIAINDKGQINYDHFGSEPNTMERFHTLMCIYNEEVTIKNIPMDEAQSYYTRINEEGEKQVVIIYE